MSYSSAFLLHLPVLHRGYIELFKRLRTKQPKVLVLGETILKEVRFLERDISAMEPADAVKALQCLGFFDSVEIMERSGIASLSNGEIILINDQLSRRLAEKFLIGHSIHWETCFLRWDESHVDRAVPVNPDKTSTDAADLTMMKEAYREAAQSGDWWRQVGSIIVKDGKIIGRTYNADLPDDQSSYRDGNIRDYIKTGTSPEYSNTFHSENRAVAEAARTGTALEGATIYVTHFPCPMCAKAIAIAGLKRCVYGEGSANFDAEKMLKAFEVEVVFCPVNHD
ncbi:MAG: hypothetical protein HY471_01390 [Candidatus Sungbacteria bacterium]|nr:hypothetical protein [Candidatus Sungbacteria bacterium]